MINYDDATTRYNESEDGLIGKWTMDLADYDSDTSTLRDYSVNGNNATNYGATFTTGKDGVANTAMDFSGGNYYLDTGLSDDLSGSGDFSVSIFVKQSANQGYAISQSRTLTPYTSDWFFLYNSNLFWFRGGIVGSQSLINDGNWHHLVMVWDRTASMYEGFVDKVSVGVSSVISGYGGVGSIKIGTRGNATSSFYGGQIDDVRIYNKKLTQDEIDYIYEDSMPYLTYDGFMARGVKQVDSIKVSDTTNKTLTRTLVDTLNISDTGDRQIEINRTATDSLSVSETFKKVLTRVIKDTVEVGEMCYRTIANTVTDTINITDKAFKTIKTTIIDTLNISDNASKIATFYRSAIDRIGTSETFKHCKNGIELIWSRLTHKPTTNYNKTNKPTTSWDNPDKPNRC